MRHGGKRRQVHVSLLASETPSTTTGYKFLEAYYLRAPF